MASKKASFYQLEALHEITSENYEIKLKKNKRELFCRNISSTLNDASFFTSISLRIILKRYHVSLLSLYCIVSVPVVSPLGSTIGYHMSDKRITNE